MWHRYRTQKMRVIENGRPCRRKNGMANIFTGIDVADIEYLSSLNASASTSSVPNTTGTQALEISDDVTSLNSANLEHSRDTVNDHDGASGNSDDLHDDRWRLLLDSVWVFEAALQNETRSHLLDNKSLCATANTLPLVVCVRYMTKHVANSVLWLSHAVCAAVFHSATHYPVLPRERTDRSILLGGSINREHKQGHSRGETGRVILSLLLITM